MFTIKLSKSTYDDFKRKVEIITYYECSSFSIGQYIYGDLDSFNGFVHSGNSDLCDENKNEPDELKNVFLLSTKKSATNNSLNKQFILFQNCKVTIMHNGILMEESYYNGSYSIK